jgi:hypothetical protein
MKSVALSLLLAAILAGQLALAGFDSPLLLLAPAAVVLGIVASAGLLGELTWLSVVAGALSPVALTWLGPVSTTLAIAGLCALWVVPRLGLARDRAELWRMASVSAVAVVLAGLVTAHYLGAGPLYHFTACVFGGATLALATVMVPADTVMASSLRAAAALLDGDLADTLARAADVHRKSRGMPCPPGTKENDWRDLLRLVEQRLSLRNETARDDADRERAELDQKILSAARPLLGTRPAAPERSTAESIQTESEDDASTATEPDPAEATNELVAAADATNEPVAAAEPACTGESADTESDLDTRETLPPAREADDGRRARPLADGPVATPEAAPR